MRFIKQISYKKFRWLINFLKQMTICSGVETGYSRARKRGLRKVKKVVDMEREQ